MTEDNHIIIAASMEAMSPKKDGSVSLRFNTYIATDEQKHLLLKLYAKSGVLMFKDAEIAPEEEQMIKDIDADLVPRKSLSQRLRGAMYVVWETHYKEYSDFNTFYEKEMTKLLSHYKDKI